MPVVYHFFTASMLIGLIHFFSDNICIFNIFKVFSI